MRDFICHYFSTAIWPFVYSGFVTPKHAIGVQPLFWPGNKGVEAQSQILQKSTKTTEGRRSASIELFTANIGTRTDSREICEILAKGLGKFVRVIRSSQFPCRYFRHCSMNAAGETTVQPRRLLGGYDRVGSSGEHLFRNRIRKPSGAFVELGLFTSPKMAEISAILFSNTATISKVHALNSEVNELTWFSALRFNHRGSQPFLENASKMNYRESLLDGLYIFPQPSHRF